jgi:uncharacterized protein (TIGR02453 family)
LAANNNKDWFNANKKRYELSVKEPFEAFIADVIAAASKLDKDFDVPVKDAVFRIYKDVRFSKDKSPYKMHMSAVVSPGGRKEGMDIPGMYLQVGAEDFRFYSGLYMPDKDMLQRVRQYLAKNSDELDAILSDKKFVKTFGQLHGEKNKVLPADLKTAAEKQPLIFNKQFYFFAAYPPEVIIKNDLLDLVMDNFAVSLPLREYLTKASTKH